MAQVLRGPHLLLEAHEFFQKQTYRNRTQILSANGILSLSIPTIGSPRKPIGAIQIDHSQRWQDRHWRSIYSAYGKAPYFEFFAEEVKDLIYSKEDHLFSFNKRLLSKCLQWLQINKEVSETITWEKQAHEGVLDLRGLILPGKPYPPLLNWQPLAYYQVFGKDFVPNLSVLDVLFCTGPEAKTVLAKSLSSI
jgi:hypothetical protein